MKNLFKYSLVGLATVMGMVACSDDDNYQTGEWNAASNYADVYFKQASGTIELDPVAPTTATIDVYRRVSHKYTYGKDSEGNDSIVGDEITTSLPALTMPLEVIENTDNVFSLGEAKFAEGDTVATIDLNFPSAEIGKVYTLKVKVTDPNFASYYSNSTVYTLSMSRAKWNLLGTGHIVENYYIGEEGDVEIYQKDSDPDVYRIMHPLDDMLASAKESPYWDAEEFNGNEPEYITVTVRNDGLLDWNTFSSGCTNLSYGAEVLVVHPKSLSSTADVSNWTFNKVLSYQDDGKTPGQLQLAPWYYMNGVGGWNQTQQSDIIIITFPGYTPPYTPVLSKDFEWEEVFGGVYVSDQLGTSSTATLYKGTCTATQNDADKIFAQTYGTAYRVESPYAEGYDLYFAIDADGGIKVPEGCEVQNTGLEAVGAPVYAKILVAESSYAENYLELGIQFQSKDGSMVYGKAVEKLMNLTYTEIGKGVYTYGVAPLSQDAESFYEGSEDATLYQCDQLPGNYYLTPWAESDGGLNFTIGNDGKIRFYQYTGEDHPNYGSVYFIDLEAYKSDYTQYLGEYDEESKTYEFNGSYYIPGVGGWGLVSETFVLTDAASAPKKLAPKHNTKSLRLNTTKASSRFVPQTATSVKKRALSTREALMF